MMTSVNDFKLDEPLMSLFTHGWDRGSSYYNAFPRKPNLHERLIFNIEFLRFNSIKLYTRRRFRSQLLHLISIYIYIFVIY